jgi:hypothetical protein
MTMTADEGDGDGDCDESRAVAANSNRTTSAATEQLVLWKTEVGWYLLQMII